MSASYAQCINTGREPEIESKLISALRIIREVRDEVRDYPEDQTDNAADNGAFCKTLSIACSLIESEMSHDVYERHQKKNGGHDGG